MDRSGISCATRKACARILELCLIGLGPARIRKRGCCLRVPQERRQILSPLRSGWTSGLSGALRTAPCSAEHTSIPQSAIHKSARSTDDAYTDVHGNERHAAHHPRGSPPLPDGARLRGIIVAVVDPCSRVVAFRNPQQPLRRTVAIRPLDRPLELSIANLLQDLSHRQGLGQYLYLPGEDLPRRELTLISFRATKSEWFEDADSDLAKQVSAQSPGRGFPARGSLERKTKSFRADLPHRARSQSEAFCARRATLTRTDYLGIGSKVH